MGKTSAVIGVVLCLACGCRFSRVPGSCESSSQCLDKTLEGYDATKPVCDPTSRLCVARPARDVGVSEGGPIDAGPGEAPVFDVLSPDSGLGPGKACKSGSECQTGLYCTNSVCCSAASCKECNQCDATGTCAPVQAGKAPAGQCTPTGDATCGAGKCDDKGACDYRNQGCAEQTTCAAGGSTLTTYACDGTTHKCTSSPSSCSPYLCNGAKACSTGCTGHGECVTTPNPSVCDRSQAHDKAIGSCIDPGDVTTVAGSDLQAAVTGLKTKYLRIPAGSYTQNLNVNTPTTGGIFLVGLPGAIIKPALAGAAITVNSNTQVTVQGLNIVGAFGAGGHGIYCNGGSSVTSSLTVVESTIGDPTLGTNTGIGITASSCNVTLRRNTVQSNSAGGVKLDTGTFEVTDNLIINNGSTSSSDVGGVSLNGSTVTVLNNTVAYNHVKGVKQGGIICTGGETLKNNIVSGNDNNSLLGLCAFTYSDVVGTTPPPGAGNTNVDCGLSANKPTVAACNGGGNPAGATKLDRGSATRNLSAGPVSMGCYEVHP